MVGVLLGSHAAQGNRRQDRDGAARGGGRAGHRAARQVFEGVTPRAILLRFCGGFGGLAPDNDRNGQDRMRQWILGLGLALGVALSAGQSRAEDVWLQIEARPTKAEAEERARAYSGVFDNVRGFALGNGWYGIVLGPFTPEEADRQLRVLKTERMIPRDSFVADTTKFDGAFWPADGAAAPSPGAPAEEAPAPETATAEPLSDAPAPEVAVPAPTAEPQPDPATESPQEARAAEASLSQADRELVQSALQWNGVYTGKIDGAFGSGTRKSIAAWQEKSGHEPTGVLTSAQRRALTEGYRTEQAALGLETVREEEAGIEITLPGKLVAFKGYEPPFVQYEGKDGSDYKVLLISQQGDENTLFGLYDIMQTLEIVPLQGERERKKSAFVLTGANEHVASYTQAELRGGLIRGFTLVWNPKDAAQAGRVLEAMKASFKPYGDKALDEGLGEPSSTPAADLVSGLQVRKPLLSLSGFYADAAGTVVTSADVIRHCGRLTLDEVHEAELVAEDKATGLAILRPREPLAPPTHAALQVALPRSGVEVAIAGYSYGDALDAPVVTFGTLSGTTGLEGEADRLRLTAHTRDGDAGGPVFDTAGSVIGILLPRTMKDGRVLPDDAVSALKAEPIVAALTAAGITPQTSALSGAMPAEDLTRHGREMTVLVSCWE